MFDHCTSRKTLVDQFGVRAHHLFKVAKKTMTVLSVEAWIGKERAIRAQKELQRLRYAR